MVHLIPIGNHHIEVAVHLLNYVDQVWMLPCYESYYGKKLVNASHRIKMCELAIQGVNDEYYKDRIIVSDFQIVHKMGKTYDCVRKLNSMYPVNTFYVAQGIDNTQTIQQWHHWQELIAFVPFIVVPRKGYMVEGNEWFTQNPHMMISENSENGGSSSLIRKLIREHMDISQYVVKDVEMYIKKNKLYSEDV